MKGSRGAIRKKRFNQCGLVRADSNNAEELGVFETSEKILNFFSGCDVIIFWEKCFKFLPQRVREE